MGTVDQHSDSIHFVNNATAKIGKSHVVIMATTARKIVAIIGKQHLAHPQTIKQTDHIGVSVERIDPLNIKGNCHLALALGLYYLIAHTNQAICSMSL